MTSIGIFDSGFGGLTVMRAIKRVLPKESIIYFGDTARLPYGNKSAETVLRYSLESAHFLVDQKIKLLVIACSTACSLALEEIQRSFTIPVVGVTLAGVEDVVRLSKTKKIAVLGTRATIGSGFYQQQIQHRIPDAEIFPIACPLFVPLVEEGYTEHPAMELVIQEYLRPLKHKEIDTLLLGCTHYPLIQASIQKELGHQVLLVDPSTSCAINVRDVLIKHKLKSSQMGHPTYAFYVSDDPEKFRLLGKTYLDCPIEHVHSKPL